MQYTLLNKITCPADVKQLPSQSLAVLCAEIRAFLLANVSQTGGHLASNLGIVELTVALHRVFDTSLDRILFDVGHQSYVHKMLTGRMDGFANLRHLDGLSGFSKPSESIHDAFISGHASTSVSVGLGMARARTLQKQSYRVISVIGDGALTGGMAYEALNDAGSSGEPLIVVLNDNKMSISPNVGALAAYLSGLRSKKRYFNAKRRVKRVLYHLPGGRALTGVIRAGKNKIKAVFLPHTIFEQMGFKYLGPVNGHDIAAVELLLRQADSMKCPVVVHVKTVKGKGYRFSEEDPGQFHGIAKFNITSGEVLRPNTGCFSDAFGSAICALAGRDDRVTAVTAAMKDGTGLGGFADAFPNRFFDVGIAEEHAVTMAAGMAKQGMRPVCAIYATFLQRAFDQLIHDVCIDPANVVLAVDRAGIVGEDGETHNGVFAVPQLLTLPNMRVYMPSNYSELAAALQQALEENGPGAVCYPRGAQGEFVQCTFPASSALMREGTDITLVSYGVLINEALRAADLLCSAGVTADIVKVNCITSFADATLRASLRKTRRLAVLEDCVASGSLGEHIAAWAATEALQLDSVRLFNTGMSFQPPGTVVQIRQRAGIDAEHVAHHILEDIGKGEYEAAT